MKAGHHLDSRLLLRRTRHVASRWREPRSGFATSLQPNTSPRPRPRTSTSRPGIKTIPAHGTNQCLSPFHGTRTWPWTDHIGTFCWPLCERCACLPVAPGACAPVRHLACGVLSHRITDAACRRPASQRDVHHSILPITRCISSHAACVVPKRAGLPLHCPTSAHTRLRATRYHPCLTANRSPLKLKRQQHTTWTHGWRARSRLVKPMASSGHFAAVLEHQQHSLSATCSCRPSPPRYCSAPLCSSLGALGSLGAAWLCWARASLTPLPRPPILARHIHRHAAASCRRCVRGSRPEGPT